MNHPEFNKHLVKVKAYLGYNKGRIAEELGCSRTMLYHYENGANPIPPDISRKLLGIVALVEHNDESDLQTVKEDAAEHIVDVKPEKPSKCRMVPVIGMAHAGHVVDYDEIEASAQEYVPTLCQDEKAHGINIEGDSMFPLVKPRDCIIVSPSERPYNGCIVIARLSGEGVVCRTVESLGGKIRLIPKNERYDVTVHEEEDFDWMYVVYGTWSQFWND